MVYDCVNKRYFQFQYPEPENPKRLRTSINTLKLTLKAMGQVAFLLMDQAVKSGAGTKAFATSDLDSSTVTFKPFLGKNEGVDDVMVELKE